MAGQSGAHGRTTKQKARIGEAGRLIDEQAATKFRNSQGAKVKIDFTSTDRQTNKLMVLKNVEKSLGERKLIDGLNLVLSPGMKLGLLGRNGSGKTTLLRLLTGELEPDAGSVTRADRLRVICFDQNREQLDQESTLRRALAPSGDSVTFRDQVTHVTAWAKRFLFKIEQLDMQVKSLSGGEQARILIARLMLRPADLLLLDRHRPTIWIFRRWKCSKKACSIFLARWCWSHTTATCCAGCRPTFSGWMERAARISTATKARNGRMRRTTKLIFSPKERTMAALPRKEPKSNKKLSFKEQREFEQMEAAILESEAKVEAIQKNWKAQRSPTIQRFCRNIARRLPTRPGESRRLYARWQEHQRETAVSNHG